MSDTEIRFTVRKILQLPVCEGKAKKIASKTELCGRPRTDTAGQAQDRHSGAGPRQTVGQADIKS